MIRNRTCLGQRGRDLDHVTSDVKSRFGIYHQVVCCAPWGAHVTTVWSEFQGPSVVDQRARFISSSHFSRRRSFHTTSCLVPFIMSNNSNNSSNNLQSLRYSNDDDNHHLTPKLSVLDQLLLPSQKKYLDIRSVEDAWTVIRSMQIRGACVW
jgi:hypothetical protein